MSFESRLVQNVNESRKLFFRQAPKVKNYTAIVKRNHKIASNQGDVIIRHLVMPNHRTCCSEPILKWINKNLSNTAVNVMAQYRPEYHAHEVEDIARPLSREEYLQVKTFAEKQNIYVL
jgi:putative pyruvate formate lyase activating enzyme